MRKTDLSEFNNDCFSPGRGTVIRIIWYLVNAILFNSYLVLSYGLKRGLLRAFGAKIGSNVVIKPKVNIKYPWKLEVGANTWIGEGVWIDNLETVNIGSNACISQGVLILSGNHDYTKSTFDLIVKPIKINDGAWLGARSIVTQGVTIGDHAVLGVNSVSSSDLDDYWIYRGNPCQKIKERNISV